MIRYRINWLNPLSAGLVYASFGAHRTNLVKGQPTAITTGGGLGRTPYAGADARFGEAKKWDSRTAQEAVVSLDPLPLAAGSLWKSTFLVAATRRGATENATGRLIEIYGTTPHHRLYASDAVNGVRLQEYTTAGSHGHEYGSVFPVDAPSCLVAVADSSLIGSSTVNPICVNGQVAAGSLIAAGTGSWGGAAEQHRVAIGQEPVYTTAYARGFNGEIAIGAIFSGIIPLGARIELSDNPWQLFERNVFRTYSVPYRAPASAPTGFKPQWARHANTIIQARL